jgi:Zn-dependent protease with chaperone function
VADQIKTWIFVLAVPLLAGVAATLVRGAAVREWAAIVEEAKDDNVLAGLPLDLTLPAACDDSRLDLSDTPLCLRYHRAGYFLWASIAAALVGVGLLGGIIAARRWAGSNRLRLLRVFRPFLHLSVIGVVLIALLQGGLLFFGLLLAGVRGAFIMAIPIGAVWVVWTLWKTATRVEQELVTQVLGVRVPDDASHALWEEVWSVANAVQTAPPSALVVGLDANFFVIEAPVTCLDAHLHERTLYLSLPLCRILTRGELRAIIGHELAHFKGEDTAFSVRFAPIYRGTHEALLALSRGLGFGVRSVAVWPAVRVLGFFLDQFASAERTIGRFREHQADRMAARVTDPKVAAAALVKTHAFGPQWNQAEAWAVRLLGENKYCPNLSRAFAEHIGPVEGKDPLAGVVDEHVSHPIDTHPPLAARLQWLRVKVDAVRTEALDITPDDPASALIDDIEKIEERLTEAWNRAVHGQLQAVKTDESQAA